MKKLLVIDGNSILNRQYYGIRPLCTKDGVYTHAVFGFTKVLLGQKDKLSPDGIAVAFDVKQPTFRHKVYDAYKAGRHGAPEELKMQFPYAKRMAEALGTHVLTLPGYEADDILGTLSRLGEEEGVETYLLTGDKDALQLVSSATTVLLAGNNEITPYTPSVFFARYGVRPDQFVDVKALMGDTSDNIPGVSGIGEKTALKLIAAQGSLEALYDGIDSLKTTPSTLKKLQEGRESAFLSQFLARIDRKIPLDLSLADLTCRPYDTDALRILFRELEFTAFQKILTPAPGSSPITEPAAPAASATAPGFPALSGTPASGTPTTGATTDAETNDAAAGTTANSFPDAKPPQAPTSVSDTIPSPSLPTDSIPAPVLLSLEEFIPEADNLIPPAALFEGKDGLHLAACRPAGTNNTVPAEYILPGVTPAMLAGTGRITHLSFTVWDAKELYHALPTPDAITVTDDLTLAAYVLDAAATLTPEHLTLAYLSEEWDTVAPAAQMLRLQKALLTRLTEEGTLFLYQTVELPLALVLYAMEQRGFLVDRTMLSDFSQTLEATTQIAMQEIYHLAGRSFNVNSPKQLGEVLFEDLKLPVFKKTKSGYSTDAEVLEKLRPYSPIIDRITAYRQAAKFKATYADALCRAADGEGRVHTVFHQTVTATGRLSSAEPNLQNIPVRTELGREFRRAFAAKEGHLLVDADYSQIELRILAALSGDATMTDAFIHGIDIHALTASQIFGVSPEEVTSDLRKRAKAINFGIVYGIGGYSLSQDIGTSKKEADAYIAGYKATYPNVDAYLKQQIRDATEQGYVTTLFGRRRYIPELTAQRAALRSFGERVAMNSPIQGTAADIIKIAMIRVEKALAEEGFAARLILQVHDELIIEAPESEAPRVAELLRRCMEGAVSLSVPLTVDVSVGKTWYDCK